jgi:hypothetical protein
MISFIGGKTVNQMSPRSDVWLTVDGGNAKRSTKDPAPPEICLTVSKLSRLQRFILKAAYCNSLYQAVLPVPWESSWFPDSPWRDLTNEEVAMLYYGIGQYEPPRSEPTPAYQLLGVTIPEQKPGFSRRVIGDRDVPRPVKSKARASISRAMKHLEKRGLIERFTQNRGERVFYATCNLTLKGFQVAEKLASPFCIEQAAWPRRFRAQ